MKDNGGFTNVEDSGIPDDTVLKDAAEKLGAELEKEGVQSEEADIFEPDNEKFESGEEKSEAPKEEKQFEAPPKRSGEQRRLRKQLAQQAEIIARKDALIEQMRKRVGDSEHITVETAKHSLEVKQKLIEDRLADAFKEAQETNDYSTVAKLQSALSEVNTEFAKLKNYKPGEEQVYEQPYYEPAYSDQEDTPHPFEEWLEDNPWYAKDEDLRQEADAIYRDWRKRLVVNGREDLLDTYEFYEEVGKAVKSKYGIGTNQKSEARKPAQVPQYGGASHLNGAYGNDKGRSDVPGLTEFEKELAHTMPTAKPMTNKQKEDLYRKIKYSADKQQGKETIKDDRYY